jgi:chromosome segregation ATPase
MKVVIALLLLVCAGLGFGLYKVNQSVDFERAEKQNKISQLELLQSDLKNTSAALEDQQQVNAKLDTDLTERASELDNLSNQLEALKTEIGRTVAKADAEAKAAQEAIAKKQQEIEELEGQNANLNSKMLDLTTAIDELEAMIADTERKLAASEGDREFLLAELKRLQTEKSDLERQFNDLALLRDQIRKLKDELSIASRLEWIRRGLYGTESKGTEKLQAGFATPAGPRGVDLDVQIRETGEAEVSPPTNSPPNNP